MSTDHRQPDDAAPIEDLPARSEDADASKVKGGGIVPEANSLLAQPPEPISPVLRGIGIRATGFRSA